MKTKTKTKLKTQHKFDCTWELKTRGRRWRWRRSRLRCGRTCFIGLPYLRQTAQNTRRQTTTTTTTTMRRRVESAHGEKRRSLTQNVNLQLRMWLWMWIANSGKRAVQHSSLATCCLPRMSGWQHVYRLYPLFVPPGPLPPRTTKSTSK